MSGIGGGVENCLFCFKTTHHLSLKDVKKEPTKLISAVCSLLNLPNPPYDKVLESSIFCNDCFGMLHKVEQILEDLENIQLKMLDAKNEIEKELTKSIQQYKIDSRARARDSVNSRNRTKIFEKINCVWNPPPPLLFPLSSNNFDPEPDPDFTIDGVEAILNSIKKEQGNAKDNDDLLSELDFGTYDDYNDNDFEDQIIPNSESAPQVHDNDQVKLKSSQVILQPLELPLEYFSQTFSINEAFIQSYIQRDLKSINQIQVNRQTNLKIPNKKKRNFYCDLCHMNLPNSRRYDEHIRLKHDTKTPFKCDLCSRSFKLLRYLTDHLKAFHKLNKDMQPLEPIGSYQGKSRTKIIKVDKSNLTNCQECDYSPESVIDLHLHNLSTHEDKGKKNFDCPICLKKIIGVSARYKEHLLLHSPSQPFVCSCGSKFKVLRYLRDHAKKMGHVYNDQQENKSPNRNKVGIKRTRAIQDTGFDSENSNSNISGHLRNKSSSRRIEVINCFKEGLPICECGYSANSITDFYLHKFEVHDPRENYYSCPLCNKMLSQPSKYKEHIQMHGEERPYECDLCSSKFKIYRYLQDHKKLSHGSVHQRRKSKQPKSFNNSVSTVDDEFLCNDCGKIFKKGKSYRNHCKLHHLEKSIVCELCGQAFVIERYLVTHKRFHHGIGKPVLFCEICPYKALSSRALEIHKQTVHEKRKDFVCEFCSSRFSRKSHLSEHIQNLHSGIPIDLNCHICQKEFHSHKGLKTHLKYCPNPYPKFHLLYKGKFRCKESNCSKEFSSNGTLKRHILQFHRGIYNFPCLQCDKKFSIRNQLTRHMMNRHGVEKPFSCSECNKRFPNLWHLKRHRLMRHADDDEKLFKCNPCGKSYGTKESLYFHNMHHHPNSKVKKVKKEKKDLKTEPVQPLEFQVQGVQDPNLEILEI